MTITCPHCQAVLPATGDAFCSECHESLTDENATPEPTPVRPGGLTTPESTPLRPGELTTGDWVVCIGLPLLGLAGGLTTRIWWFFGLLPIFSVLVGVLRLIRGDRTGGKMLSVTILAMIVFAIVWACALPWG